MCRLRGLRPTASGQRTGDLTIQVAGVRPQVVPLDGGMPIEFPTVQPGATAVKWVELPAGTTAVSGTVTGPFAIALQASYDYGSINGISFALSADTNGVCSPDAPACGVYLGVEFLGTATPGPSTGTVTLNNGLIYSLSANVLGPGLIFTPSSIDGGSVPIGSTNDGNSFHHHQCRVGWLRRHHPRSTECERAVFDNQQLRCFAGRKRGLFDDRLLRANREWCNRRRGRDSDKRWRPPGVLDRHGRGQSCGRANRSGDDCFPITVDRPLRGPNGQDHESICCRLSTNRFPKRISMCGQLGHLLHRSRGEQLCHPRVRRGVPDSVKVPRVPRSALLSRAPCRYR